MELANVVELYDNIRVPLLTFGSTALVLFITLPLAALVGFGVGYWIRKARRAKSSEGFILTNQAGSGSDNLRMEQALKGSS